MQSRLFVNLFLLLIAIGLIVFMSQQEDDSSTQTTLLTDIPASTINKIGIRHKQRNISLVKQNQHWYITEPVNIAANDFRIGTLLKLLTTVSHSRYAADTLELERFGLLTPATTIHFNETEIAFGIVNPINNYRYVQIDNTVHLIDDLYYPLLSSQLGTLVSLRLLDENDQIIKLELPGQIISRGGGANWKSTGTASTDDIVATINNWKTTQAFGVHNYFKRDALDTVSVTLKDKNQPVNFIITDTDPWLVLARPELGIEYHLNLDAYDALLNPGKARASSQAPPDNDNKDVLQVPPDEFLQNLNH